MDQVRVAQMRRLGTVESVEAEGRVGGQEGQMMGVGSAKLWMKLTKRDHEWTGLSEPCGGTGRRVLRPHA